MTFLDQLLTGGVDYYVELTQCSASFRPAARGLRELAAFQEVVRQIDEHDGEGYRVYRDHLDNDATGLVDLVVISFERNAADPAASSDEPPTV